ncbi:MAG TPA: 3-oxoadipate enol-lactonase [Aliidongia sp.]|uniref:3-oxoadipate enol-lactonase n=1 Tax=Aliidongia sp. TaxID=1914230 RepID=UPI002DDCCB60|nr:3-oxoadipate enol-lactonase [Aliidongia sp.]HEV2673464.1 3-oxoadipate enol-lactonase [Aliidongia sp.]
MAFVLVDGLSVHYRIDGPADAPPLLLIHSLGTALEMWAPQAEALADAFRVISYDLRGHGLSEGTAGDYSLALLARYAVGLLDALGVERAHVAGVSLGGMIAQTLGIVHGRRVRSLVLGDTASLIGPKSNWDNRAATIRADGMASVVDMILGRWFTPDLIARSPAIARGFGAMLLRMPAEAYISASFAVRDGDTASGLAAIACPTLVLVGDQDVSTPPAAAEALVAAIAGARLTVITQAAHIPTVERPAEVTAAIRQFLAGL